MYYLYVHTVPNGKKYIGMTENPEKRWHNGLGYKDNKLFFEDINNYGWDNIKHEIIKEFDTFDECHLYERFFISLLGTEDERIGYNQSNYKKDFYSIYNKKKDYKCNDKQDHIKKSRNIFDEYNISYDAGLYMINQWIFNEKYRLIIKYVLLDGYTYDETAKLVGMSVRQTKEIVYQSQDKLKRHM